MASMSWRSSFCRALLAATMVVVTVGMAGAADGQPRDKQVLVLYSTRPDAQLSIIGESKLPQILNLDLAQNVVHYSEFIDASTFPARAHETLLEFLRLKYEGIRFDLVIAIQEE